jgi:hypothetical protein
MATVTDKQVDMQAGAVHLRVKDAILGNESLHTIYLSGPSGVVDVNAAIEQIKADTDSHAQVLHDRLSANGLL